MTVIYRSDNNLSFIKNGEKHSVKKQIIDGNYLSFSYLNKKGNYFYRIFVKEEKDGKFNVKEKKGDKDEDTKIISESELMKMLGKNKDLDFVLNYLKKEQKKHKAKRSKKTSKKTSKKKKSRKLTGGSKVKKVSKKLKETSKVKKASKKLTGAAKTKKPKTAKKNK